MKNKNHLSSARSLGSASDTDVSKWRIFPLLVLIALALLIAQTVATAAPSSNYRNYQQRPHTTWRPKITKPHVPPHINIPRLMVPPLRTMQVNDTIIVNGTNVIVGRHFVSVRR